MRKKIYSITFAFISNIALWAQFPGWAWEKTPVGTSNANYGSPACASDAAGNLYAAGNFASSNLVLGGYTLTSHDTGTGRGDIFVAKYDPSGNVVWAASAGGNDIAFANSVAVDAGGNVYVCGWFFGDSLVFPGAILRSQHIIVLIQAANGFIAKYDALGNFMWAVAEDTTSYGVILLNGIAVAPTGGVYVSGAVESTPIIFGGDTIFSNDVGESGVLLMKLDSSGNIVWAQDAGSSHTFTSSLSVTADKNSNAYITGYYSGSSLSIGATTLTNAGGDDIYIAKYDAGGNPVWAQSVGGSGAETGYGIASDQYNNIYLTGFFESDSIAFGSVHLALQDTGGSDIFLAKYDSSGNALWAKQASGSSSNYGQRISTDKLGNIFMAGSFSGTAINFGSNILTNTGTNNGFVANYNNNGQLQWVQGIQGTGNDYPADVAGDGHGNCYVTGTSNSVSIPFGSIAFSNPDTPNYGIFVAKAGTATGIELPVATDVQVMVYPNPTSSFLKIKYNSISTIGRIEILNMLGQQVYETNYLEQEIDVSDLYSGVYLLRIEEDGKSACAPFVKQ